MSEYSVTFPTLPEGVYTQYVTANGPAEAIRAAAELEWPTNPGYTVELNKEPEVWIVRRPYRVRSKRVSGPNYGG
jgi:hypothetical protein